MVTKLAFKKLKVSPGFLYALTVAVFFATAAGIYGLFHVSTNSPRVLSDSSQHSVPAFRSSETISFGEPQRTFSTPGGFTSILSKLISALTQLPLEEPGGVAKKREFQDLAAALLDESLPLKFRRQAAWELAKICDDESTTRLERALALATPHLKSGIAEALGHCPHPKARKIIASLLSDEDEIAVRGAIRGLAAIGDSQSVRTLGGILLDDQRSESVRSEAALALGEADTWEAYHALVEALGQVEDEEMAREILAGLGKMEFDRTEGFFRKYVESASVTGELRVAAIEALGNASGNPARFLLEFLKDEDREARAAAAWSLGMLDISDNVAQAMTAFLTLERDPEVRLRISQALQSSGQRMHEQ